MFTDEVPKLRMSADNLAVCARINWALFAGVPVNWSQDIELSLQAMAINKDTEKLRIRPVRDNDIKLPSPMRLLSVRHPLQ